MDGEVRAGRTGCVGIEKVEKREVKAPIARNCSGGLVWFDNVVGIKIIVDKIIHREYN